MYGKIFASLYQGTLRGKSHEILVFTNLIASCDREGFVDKHFKAIADEVGLTLEEVKQAVSNLEKADPESRSSELDGSRLEKIEEHREWGWRIVNYVKYRMIRDEEERREYNRLRQAEYRAKKKGVTTTVTNVNDMLQMSNKCTNAEAEGKADAEAYKKKEEYTESFEVFWKSYPKKTGKGGAYNEWRKIPVATHGKIMTSLEVQKLSRQWGSDGGKFIPNPQTWLHQKRWDDELEGAKPKETDFSDWTNKTFR